MVDFERDKFRQYIHEFADVAKTSPEQAAEKFVWYVHGLNDVMRGSLKYAHELAVLNVGSTLLDRVLPVYQKLNADERRQYPGVCEALGQAREALGIRPAGHP